MNELNDSVAVATGAFENMALFDIAGLEELLLRFFLNLFCVAVVVHCLYYPKCKRRDFHFTFMLIGVSIFLLMFFMGGVKLRVGVALGLFAVFGIIRYRTESVPIREMTYLFIVIAISAINAIATGISWLELFAADVLFVMCIWLCESNRTFKHMTCKLVQYDRIELITPEHEAELYDDLQHRLGVKVQKIEVGSVDFLKDSAIIKVYYEEASDINSVNCLARMPKDC